MENWIIVRRVTDTEIEAAPFNGGEGGGFIVLALEEVDGDQADGFMIWEDLGDGLFEVVGPIERVHIPQKNQLIAHGTTLQLELTHDHNEEPRWLDRLSTHGKQVSELLGLCLIRGETVAVWIGDGGRALWREDQTARDLAKTKAKKARELREMHDSGEHFVNPYTFVPLPQGIHRERPRGHASLGEGGLSGTFDWTLQFGTPLILPGQMTTAAGHLTYPGSALRGVLRSLHEVVAGGCLREVDLDYVPVHREPLNVGKPSYRLAVVAALDPVTHAVTQVMELDDTTWVPLTDLTGKRIAGPFYSGQRVRFATPLVRKRVLQRFEDADAVPIPDQDGDWVIHLTEAKARPAEKRYFAAVGRRTDQVRTIDSPTWARWRRLASGSQDLIREDARDTSGESPRGTGWGKPVEYVFRRKDRKKNISEIRIPVGQRRATDGWLSVGDTVWLDDQNHLKPSVVWRRLGDHPVKDRLPEPLGGRTDLEPCRDPGALCPSCAIFGSVDPSRGEKEQRGYASHVRVGFGRSSDNPASAHKSLPPLRAPKPSAGGFYLLHGELSGNDGAASKKEGHVTRAHWGSSIDDKGPARQIRGRKFYWHGQTNDSNGRHTPRHFPAEQLGQRNVVDAPFVLTVQITFDNLEERQLGYLLAAADPSLVLDSEDVVIHVGGGKPLGFGTAAPSVSNLHVDGGASRYGGNTCSVSIASSIKAAVNDPEELSDRAHVWAALRQVLNPKAVPADRIWYPTVKPFPATDKTFDHSFAWFGVSSGGWKGNLTLLPHLGYDDQYLPISGGQQE